MTFLRTKIPYLLLLLAPGVRPFEICPRKASKVVSVILIVGSSPFYRIMCGAEAFPLRFIEYVRAKALSQYWPLQRFKCDFRRREVHSGRPKELEECNTIFPTRRWSSFVFQITTVRARFRSYHQVDTQPDTPYAMSREQLLPRLRKPYPMC